MILAILNLEGISLVEAGDYAGAEPLYRRALAIDEKARNAGHLRTAITLNNLANLLRLQGRLRRSGAAIPSVR